MRYEVASTLGAGHDRPSSRRSSNFTGSTSSATAGFAYRAVAKRVAGDLCQEATSALETIVEGCAVYTKYGHIRSDHILFIAAGAFHFHKPSELIPELQGRFPVRVALRSLTEADFVRILTEPKNCLVRQYQALFATEGVNLEFSEDGIARLAAIAFRANLQTQNIGARRLMTILEKCLEELSFEASDRDGEAITVDAALVERQLGETADDEDLIPYDM